MGDPVAHGHAMKGATSDPWNTEGIPAKGTGTPKVFQRQALR
jgi:hypothetical protein